MRISDLSSDVCSSDLARITRRAVGREGAIVEQHRGGQRAPALALQQTGRDRQIGARRIAADQHPEIGRAACRATVRQYVELPGVAVTLKKQEESIQI